METIFKAENNMVEMLRQTKDKLHSACRPHLHRPVRIETIHGEVYEAMIVNMDHRHLYIQLCASMTETAMYTQGQAMRQPYPYYPPYSPFPHHYYPQPHGRPPYNPYANVLPLVLYELLAISLL